MGYVHAAITLKNPRLAALSEIETEALVDTGALMLCIPEHIVLQLQLESAATREVTTADGKHHQVPYAGPVEVRFENRNCFTGALVFGDEVLLGALPMEDMDLVVLPAERRVAVNPASPNLPHALVK